MDELPPVLLCVGPSDVLKRTPASPHSGYRTQIGSALLGVAPPQRGFRRNEVPPSHGKWLVLQFPVRCIWNVHAEEACLPPIEAMVAVVMQA
jgi:hypothetical protein